MDEIYTYCPDCRLIASAGSLDYIPVGRGADGAIDWSRPVRVRCGLCERWHRIQESDLLPRDTESPCPRRAERRWPDGCGAAVAHPAGAAQVVCLTCGLHFQPRGLDQRTADQAYVVKGLHAIELRNVVRRARGEL
jgi:hypothetical protein